MAALTLTFSVRAVLRGVLLLTSLLVMAGLGEAALRVWYRDAGRRTLGGPGGRTFDHETIDGELRGRRDVGPKTPGVPRIMVIGDSITYGLGVRDWRQTWPELLVRTLEEHGRPHQLAVAAFPGQDIRQHVDAMREWVARVSPDVFIYQWYVNDIEAISHRPDLTHPWQRWRWHAELRDWSYLYYVADHRLSQWLPAPTRTYVDYLLTDFAPGTMEWAEFERQFHELATRAAIAPRRLIALYPQVPFRERYPLQPLHDRMRTLARSHELDIPPAAWIRSGGVLATDGSAPWKQAFSVPAKSVSGAVETPEYVFASGPLTIVLVAKTTAESATPGTVGTVALIDAATGGVISETPLDLAGEPAAWRTVSLPFTLTVDGLQRVRLRVRSAGGAAWALADIRVLVDYGFDVIDLAEPLNAISTHASAFDAHPNEAAHRVIADQIHAVLRGQATRAPAGR